MTGPIDLRSSITVTGSLTVDVDPATYQRLRSHVLTGLLVGPPVRAKTPDEMRWEDDGGPPSAITDGYEHDITWQPS